MGVTPMGGLRRWRRRLLVIGFCGWIVSGTAFGGDQVGDRRSEQAIADQIDGILQRSTQETLPPRTDDVSFLRRISLDLLGHLPTTDELHRFAEEASPAKRAALIDRLLESDAYAVNWGRYWRDVLTYHTPASG